MDVDENLFHVAALFAAVMPVMCYFHCSISQLHVDMEITQGFIHHCFSCLRCAYTSAKQQ